MLGQPQVIPDKNNEEVEEDEEDDVIDIDNPDDLAAKGLKRIQIEGEEEEYLMDLDGNIYDLRGNFIGTTDDDGVEGGAPANLAMAGIAVGTSDSQPHQIIDETEDNVDYDEY